jgi:hypothetical protein
MTTAGLWAEFAPAVYAVWANYWLSAGNVPPPLRIHKPTASGGAVFLAPVGSAWVRRFITAHHDDPEFYFENQGDELANFDHNNLGIWGAFSAMRRADVPAPVGVPLLPMPLPTPPDAQMLRSIRRRTR